MRPDLATLVLAPLALTGCGFSCTLMYAPSRVTLELQGDAFSPGLYEVELGGYGEIAMCVLTLPSAEGDLVSCTDNARIELDPTGERILSFTATGFAPDSFSATILLDGEILAQEDFAPAYDVVEPNGPGCGESSFATLAMAIE